VIVTTPKGTQYKYFYTDTTGVYQSFILSEGSGKYKVGVYKNVSGTSYTTLHSTSFTVQLSSDIAPFLRANFFVDYTLSTKAVKAAVTLCKNCDTELKKVDAVYYYILNNFSYDYNKAATVQSGYRPILDTVWDAKKGICFDYASTMAAMLRSQGVASKLIVGYAGTSYHAWINVYTKETGWIEAVIYFDGANWKLMDPTFASTGKSSQAIMDFINNPSNYTAKYIY
jgi:transglutaminase-like putative cysteine protease